MPFIIDDDAYKLLATYFDSLKEVLSHSQSDPEEVLTDIEVRCAEILSDKYGANAIISTTMINALIEQMGEAEDIIDIDTTFSHNHQKIKECTFSPPPIPTPTIRKRLFRSEDDSMIGGVCGGIAAYFDIDVTWVRLIVIVLCFLSLSTVAIIYIILWIVLPVATTPYQKMQMRGTSPTLDNIGRTVADDYRGFKDDFNSQSSYISENRGKKIARNIVNIFSALAKAFLIFLSMISIPVLISLIVAAGAIFFVLCALPFQIPAAAATAIADIPLPGLALAMTFCALLVIAFPLLMLILTMLSSLSTKKWIENKTMQGLAIAWGVSFGLTIILGIFWIIFR